MRWIELRNFEVSRGTFRLHVPELSIPEGEMVAVVGPNGSGKSTLLSALAGLRPFRGTYLLARRPFSLYPEGERSRLLAYLPQGGRLGLPFEVFYVVLTGRYPLLSGRDYTPEDYLATEEILRLFDLEPLRRRLFGELSGGERQRVLLARTLNRASPILLLDEPLNAVDLRHQHLLIRHVRDYVRRKKGACLAVLHDLALALKYFDRFVLLQGGDLVGVYRREALSGELVGEVLGVDLSFVRHGEETLISVTV
ncbi:ABC transporter ATP-binding protein [Thermosulfurimonas sp. F29]|uniref:ABC transporter ATP-binding protein n=1 Tax=Thermosulfurimonas sp. F29 TaxID=2867247 RepID=UPI001C83832A|nr:ABC transporter ATP-binding protein [Thermosulfurimonas sp. F29]MBX6423700.1 ABC transporter ATP-binding protein [Thermosulfurimonas sp. F29]